MQVMSSLSYADMLSTTEVVTLATAAMKPPSMVATFTAREESSISRPFSASARRSGSYDTPMSRQQRWQVWGY